MAAASHPRPLGPGKGCQPRPAESLQKTPEGNMADDAPTAQPWRWSTNRTWRNSGRKCLSTRCQCSPASRVQSTVPALAWTLLGANVFWAIAYDTEYAMVDRPDDLKIGIKTSAITFGRFDVAAVMACYGITFGLIAWVGHGLHRGWPFYAGLVGAAGLAIYHYTLIRTREGGPCFKAFLHNNWVGASIFTGIVVDFWIHPTPLISILPPLLQQ